MLFIIKAQNLSTLGIIVRLAVEEEKNNRKLKRRKIREFGGFSFPIN